MCFAPQFSGRSLSVSNCMAEQCGAICVKDLGKVRSYGWWHENFLLVCRSEVKLCRELQTGFIRCADRLSNGRHLCLSLCWGSGFHMIPVWLCVPVGEYVHLRGWEALMHYKSVASVSSSSKSRRAHTNTNIGFRIPALTFSHFAVKQ